MGVSRRTCRYTAEGVHFPFPDDQPIIYPPADVSGRKPDREAAEVEGVRLGSTYWKTKDGPTAKI